MPIGKRVILASCDSKYFIDHAATLVCSVVKNTTHSIHIHIINATDDVKLLAHDLQQLYPRFTTTHEQTEHAVDRVYYACNRFLIAPLFLRSAVESLLIVDIDGFFLRDFTWPDATFGLFLRDPLPGTVGFEHYATHVAAGIVLYDKNALDIAEAVRSLIEKNASVWFADQAALYNVYQAIGQFDDLKFFQFDCKWLDWEFKSDSIMWSGKGDRKYTNKRYVEMKEVINES